MTVVFLGTVMKNIELPCPADMSSAARAGEIIAILAATIVRTFVADKPKTREVELGFPPDQRVHTTPYQMEKL